MPKRIPHVYSEAITGVKETTNYLAMQKKLGRFYLKGFIKRLIGFNKKGLFLEIGPGPAYQTSEIAKQAEGIKIKALEYSEDMISIAKKYCKTQNLQTKIEFVHGSVEDEKLVSGLGKFDLIYSTFSLHHWLDPEKAISNLYSALKDDGLIYLYDFKRGGLFYYISIKKGIWESIRASYTPDEIKSILDRLNIKNYKISTDFLYMQVIINKN